MIDAFLWMLVIIGIAARLFNPFYSNPNEFLMSDMLRHYFNAKECLRAGEHLSIVYEIMDPLGYQLWLSSVLRVTGSSKMAIALYTGLLSVITPFLWYRWMRLAISNKRMALAGYALLSLLPDWIRVYQFFLQETLVLPLLGLALWLSWRAAGSSSWGRYIAAGFGWGCALLTKATVLPMAAVVLPWLVYKRHKGWLQWRMPAAAIAVAFMIYMLGPLKIYNRIHAFVLVPPGDYHRIWYESGKEKFNYKIKFVDIEQGYREYKIYVGNPSLDLKIPNVDWKTSRNGTCDIVIDFTKTPDKYLPETAQMSFQDRVKYTIENIIYFFFGLSWPEDHVEKDAKLGIYSDIMKSFRFIWLPMTIAIIILAVVQRRRDVMVALFTGSLIFYMFQQSIILEARYKKPWEGIAVATFFSLLATSRSARRKESIAEDASKEWV